MARRSVIYTYLLQVAVHILRHLPEKHTEEASEQRACQVKTLLPEVVTVIQLSALKGGKQKSVDHITEEVRLLGLGAFGHGDVRQHLLLQNLLSIA